MEDPNYDLGEKYRQTCEDFLVDDEQEIQLQKHFIMNEDKIRENFKKKITNLAKYYEDLNRKFNFTDISREKLLEKLRENREKHLEEKLRKKHYLNKSYFFENYLIFLLKLKDNIRFYNLGKEEFENSFNISAKNNLINKMNLFSIRGESSKNKKIFFSI